MWVFCCEMYRSVSSLPFKVASRLVTEAGVGQSIGWIDAKHFADIRDRYPSDEGLKVVRVDTCSPSIAAEFLRNNAIGIYTFRDIRDVCASSMQKRLKTFDYLWKEGFVDACLESYKQWSHLPNMLMSRYEDVLEDLPREINRIAVHLGLSLDEPMSQLIAASYAVELQQERLRQQQDQHLQVQRTNGPLEVYGNGKHFLSDRASFSQAGRWKDDLSAKEVALIANRVRSWCVENEYRSSVFFR